MTKKYLSIISSREQAKIELGDILYIERNRRKINIVTAERSFEYYEKLENLEPLLDERFFPCLKGCYINLARVEIMADQKIYFDNGEVYMLGRENFIRTRQRYKEYLKKSV